MTPWASWTPSRTRSRAPSPPRAPSRGPGRRSVPPPEPVRDRSAEAPAEPTFTTYTIRTGDTLGDIGARHGVTREELARLNGIDEPDLIFPGQELRIPTS